MPATRTTRYAGIVVLIATAACGGGDGDDGRADGASRATAATDDDASGASGTGTTAPPGSESSTTPASTSAPEPASAPATTDVSPAETIMSDDGSLTIDVPAGANASGVAIAAQRIEPGLSPELDPFTTSWELGPDGTRFAEPVTVTVTLDDRWDGAVPVMLVALESADGAELVADVAAEVVAGAATFTFEIDHFSRLYLFDGSIRMSLFPSRHSGPENSPFDATLSVGAADAGVDDSFLARSIDWGADGSGVVLRSDSALSVRAEVQGFTCTTGTGRYWVDLTVSDAYADHDEVSTGSVWAEFLGLDPDVVLDGTSHRGLLYGDADCTGSGCRLEPSDPSRPSIGRTGAAAVEALPELTAGAESRDIGLGLLTDVDGGALCLEDVVSLVSDGLVTDPVRSAVETLTE